MEVAEHVYNSTILRKLRAETIAAFTDAKLALGNNYGLSAINQIRPTLTLTLNGKSLTEQSVRVQTAQVTKALLEKFGDTVALKPLGASGKEFRIDYTGEYNLRNQTEGGEGAPPKSEDPKPEDQTKKAGRKKTKASELEQEIIHILDIHTPLRLGELATGFVIIPRPAGEENVTLGFKSVIAYEQALVCLEPGYYKSITVDTVSRNLRFSISTKEGSIMDHDVRRREEASAFMTNLKKAVNMVGPRARVLTPFMLVASEKSSSVRGIQLQFTDPGDAAGAVKYFEEHFGVKKEGAMLTLSVTAKQIARFAKEEIEFAQKAEKRGLMAMAKEVSSVMGYVRMSKNYEEFHFLRFNRDTINSHVINLIESIKMFGYLQFIIVIETDIIDGVMKKWIVDGQHRFKGCKAEGFPILYTTVSGITSKYELVRLIAKLNSTSRAWGLPNYVDAWESLGIPEYVILKQQYEKTRLPLSLLIQMYEDKSKKAAVAKFMDGRFQMCNDSADRSIQWIVDIQKNCLPKSRDLCAGLYQCIKKIGDGYNHDSMKTKLRRIGRERLPFMEGDKLEEVTDKFYKIYKAAA